MSAAPLALALDRVGVALARTDLAALVWLTRRRCDHARTVARLLLALADPENPARVRVVFIPADIRRSCLLTRVAASSAVYAHLLGADLIDDIVHGPDFTMYADTRRTSRALPRNPRALAVLDHLDLVDGPGTLDQAAEHDLRGDILLTGHDGTDVDLTGPPLHAARHLGLVPDPATLTR